MEGGEDAGLDNRQAPGTETELAAADQQRTQFGDDRPQFRSASPTDRSGPAHGDRRTGHPASPTPHLGEEVPTKRFTGTRSGVRRANQGDVGGEGGGYRESSFSFASEGGGGYGRGGYYGGHGQERRDGSFDARDTDEAGLIHTIRAKLRSLEASIAAIEYKQWVQNGRSERIKCVDSEDGFAFDRDRRAGAQIGNYMCVDRAEAGDREHNGRRAIFATSRPNGDREQSGGLLNLRRTSRELSSNFETRKKLIMPEKFNRMPENLDEAYRVAVVMEANGMGRGAKVGLKGHERYDMRTAYVRHDDEPVWKSAEQDQAQNSNELVTRDRAATLHQAIDKLCKAFENFKAENSSSSAVQPTALSREPRRGGRRGACYICNDSTHQAGQCPDREHHGHARHSDMFPAETTAELPRQGHYQEQQAPSISYQPNGLTEKVKERAAAYLRAQCGSLAFDCLLDTGAERSLYPLNMVNSKDIKPTDAKVFAVNGTPVRVVGTAEAHVKVGDHELHVDSLVVEGIERPILGIDWLRRHGGTWDFASNSISIYGMKYSLSARLSKAQEPDKCLENNYAGGPVSENSTSVLP